MASHIIQRVSIERAAQGCAFFILDAINSLLSYDV